MAKPFEEALKAYFKAKHPGTKYINVEIEFEEGYHYSEYTNEDSSFYVKVRGFPEEEARLYIDKPLWAWPLLERHDNVDGAEFLSNLFAWEDQTPPTSPPTEYCGQEPHFNDNPPESGPPDFHWWNTNGDDHRICPRSMWKEMCDA
jgi:hypothetical protein